MTALDDLRASADTTRDVTTGAGEQVRAAFATADQLYRDVVSLGLEGIAATVQQAQDHLEAAASGLTTASDAAHAASTGLREVTEQTERAEALERLGTVRDQLDQAAVAVDAATGNLEEAFGYALHADVGDLAAVISAACDALSVAGLAVGDTRAKTGTYRQQVEKLAGTGTPVAPSRHPG